MSAPSPDASRVCWTPACADPELPGIKCLCKLLWAFQLHTALPGWDLGPSDAALPSPAAAWVPGHLVALGSPLCQTCILAEGCASLGSHNGTCVWTSRALCLARRDILRQSGGILVISKGLICMLVSVIYSLTPVCPSQLKQS